MNKKYSGLILLSVFLATAISICGQKRQVTLGEFYDTYTRALEKKIEISKRVEGISETVADGIVTSSTTILSENLLPNKSRFVYKEKNGDSVKESETITIDNFQYTRENGGAWTKIDLSKQGSGGGSASGGISNHCQQITVEPTFLNSYAAKLYEKLRITSELNGLNYSEERHWISDEGLLLRSETSGGLLSPKIETKKSVTTYEYNPKDLKIEAPIK